MPQEQMQSQSARQHVHQEQVQHQHTQQLNVETESFDAVLDDIESVLSTNAQEYVSSFVQQGGE